MVHPLQCSLVEGTVPGDDHQLLQAALMLGIDNSHEEQDAAVINISKRAESTVVELPPFAGFRVVKETFHRADWTLERPMSRVSIEDRVETQSAAFERPLSLLPAIKFLMTKDWVAARKKPQNYDEWKKLWRGAYAELWRLEGTWDQVEERRQAAGSAMSHAIEAVNVNYPSDGSNEFQRFDRDQIAGSNEAILPWVAEDTIYVTFNKRGKITAFGYPRAVQAMLVTTLSRKLHSRWAGMPKLSHQRAVTQRESDAKPLLAKDQ